MARAMNHRRRLARAERAQREQAAPVQRNPVALAMALRNGDGRHVDRKREASRRACRGDVQRHDD